MTGPFALVLERRVPAEVDRVWRAFTTVDGLSGWWWSQFPGTTWAVDLRVGGAYRFDCPGPDFGVRGEYHAVEAPTRFAASWIWRDGLGPDGADGPVEEIDVRLDPVDDGAATLITISHTGPWTGPEPAENYRLGWDSTLDVLERTLG